MLVISDNENHRAFTLNGRKRIMPVGVYSAFYDEVEPETAPLKRWNGGLNNCGSNVPTFILGSDVDRLCFQFVSDYLRIDGYAILNDRENIFPSNELLEIIGDYSNYKQAMKLTIGENEIEVSGSLYDSVNEKCFPIEDSLMNFKPIPVFSCEVLNQDKGDSALRLANYIAIESIGTIFTVINNSEFPFNTESLELNKLVFTKIQRLVFELTE